MAAESTAVAGWRDYLELSKARIVLMIVMTTAFGFVFGSPGPIEALLLFHTLVGTALVAAGTNALNQYAERNFDKLMARTRNRPLPGGRMTERAALVFSAGISIVGLLQLALAVNLLAAGLAFFTLASYLFIYTPLKRKTTLCTLIGAVPGAIPPMIGWAASAGALMSGAWFLFALMLVWQLPHFMAISWIYREDYGRAGFEMVSVHDPDGRRTSAQAVFYSVLLIVVSLFPLLADQKAIAYAAGALLLGFGMLATAVSFARFRRLTDARRLFLASNVYLLVTLALIGVTTTLR